MRCSATAASSTPLPAYFGKSRSASRPRQHTSDMGERPRAGPQGPCAPRGCRTDEVREHHRDLAALRSVLSGLRECRGSFGCRRFRAPVSAEQGDGIEQLTTVSNDVDTKVLQVLGCDGRQDRLVYLVLAERRLIPFEAQAPQPTPEVHKRALNASMCLSSFRRNSVSRRAVILWER